MRVCPVVNFKASELVEARVSWPEHPIIHTQKKIKIRLLCGYLSLTGLFIMAGVRQEIWEWMAMCGWI